MKKFITLLICCSLQLFASAQWTPLYIGNTTANLWDVFFLNDEVGFVGGGEPNYPYNYIFLKTTDGGQTWNSIPVPLDYAVGGIWFINDSIGLISGPNVILRTTDQCTTWDTVAFIDGYDYRKFDFLDSLIGFCNRDDSLFKTTDGGASWTSLPHYFNEYSIKDYDFSSEDSGIIASYDGVFQIITTTDGGYNWNVNLEGGAYEDGWTCVKALSNTKLAAVGYGTYPGWNYNLSSDDGTTWTSYSLPIPWGYQELAMSFLTPDTGYIVGHYIVKTTDGGLSWVVDDSTYANYSSALFQVTFTSDGTGYAVGEQGLILKHSNGIAQASDNISLSTQIFQIWPNPVHDVLQLRTKEAGTLTILNALGETLLSKNLSNNRIEIDVSFLMPAVYYVELLTEKGILVSKFVKE